MLTLWCDCNNLVMWLLPRCRMGSPCRQPWACVLHWPH